MSLLTLSIATLLVVYATATSPKEPRLIWEDNFDSLDEGRWNHLVTGWDGGNAEFQYYRNNRKNSYVEGGILKIRPTPTSDEVSDFDMRNGQQYDPQCNMEPCTVIANPVGNTIKPVYSARMHTQNKFTVTYGRVEVRAKLPRGDWLWPAIWMMPNQDVYGGWPASGEIDIMESRGNKNLHDAGGKSVGINNVGSTLHWGPYWPYNGWGFTHWETVRNGDDFSDDFHTYAVQWTPDNLVFSIDGQVTGSADPPNPGGFWVKGHFDQDPGGNNPWAGGALAAPFDKPFYIILNVAVAGGFFDPSFTNGNGKPWDLGSGRPWAQWYDAQGQILSTWDRPAMEVDWVRVYEL